MLASVGQLGCSCSRLDSVYYFPSDLGWGSSLLYISPIFWSQQASQGIFSSCHNPQAKQILRAKPSTTGAGKYICSWRSGGRSEYLLNNILI